MSRSSKRLKTHLCFLRFPRSSLIGTKGVDVGDACVGGACVGGACSVGTCIGSTGVGVTCGGRICIRDACVSSVGAVERLGIHLQSSRI